MASAAGSRQLGPLLAPHSPRQPPSGAGMSPAVLMRGAGRAIVHAVPGAETGSALGAAQVARYLG